jgi:hypothetical protein
LRRAYASVVAALSKPPVFLSIALGSAVIGLVFRVLWVTHAGRLLPTNSEMFFVARAFAETGRLADAYGPGSGLTAHVTPIMPILAGLVYRLTGVGTPAGEAALTLISIVLVGIGIVALNLVAKRLSIPPVARLAAIVFVCLIPINFHLEMGAFRVWEGAAATAVMAVVLAAILRMDAQPSEPSWIGMGVIAAVGGATALLSPPAALAIYGCLGLLALRKRGVFALVAVAGVSAVLLVAMSYPWAARNEAVFGQKVWSRTNFGLNFALAFHDGAVNPSDPRKVFADRLAEVDPYTSPAVLAHMKAVGGEEKYSAIETAETKAWIAGHPTGAAIIAARHVGDFYFPERWMWSTYSDKGTAVPEKQAVTWAIAFFGLLSLALRLWARDWRYLYVLLVLALPALPYLLVQPTLRYHYTVSTLLTLLSADLLFRGLARLWSERAERRADG